MNDNLLKDRLSLLVNTCDKYSDLWSNHMLFLNKNWGDRDIDTIIATDNHTIRMLEGARIAAAGIGAELPQRIAYALQTIQTEYILVTLDDYFLIKPVSNKKISALLDYMEKERLDYIRLFRDPNSHEKIINYQHLYKLRLEKNYDVNLYQGIWRKSFLVQTIREPLNAWKYEVSLTLIAREAGAKCTMSKGKEFVILDVIRKGKVLHKAARYLRRHNMSCGTRDLISWKDEFLLFLFATGKKILPCSFHKTIKTFLKNKGYIFYSD